MKTSMLRMHSHPSGIGCGRGHAAALMTQPAAAQMGRIVQMPALVHQGGPGLMGLSGVAWFHGLPGGLGGIAGNLDAGTAISISDANIYEDTSLFRQSQNASGYWWSSPDPTTVKNKIYQSLLNSGLFNPSTLIVNFAFSSYGFTAQYYNLQVLANLAQSVPPSQLNSVFNKAISDAGFASYDVNAQSLNIVGAPNPAQSSTTVPIPTTTAPSTLSNTVSFYDSEGNPITPTGVYPQSNGVSYVFSDGSDVFVGADGQISAADATGNDLSFVPSPDGSVVNFADGSIMIFGTAPGGGGSPTQPGLATQIANVLASTFGFNAGGATPPGFKPPAQTNTLGNQLSSFFASFGAPFGLGALGGIALLGIGYLIFTNTGRRR